MAHTSTADGPLVCIVIPVFNGEEHLGRCLNSVLNQTYRNWRAIIVNNASTDQTPHIADGFARKEHRIRVMHCIEHVEQAANYNRAVSQAPEEANYIKVLEADSWLPKDAIERQVEVAEDEPRAGVINCYYLLGSELFGSGLTCDQRTLSGKEVLQIFYYNNSYLLGIPTSLLFRAVALREQACWFRRGIFYNDIELCVRILKRWDIAFAHSVLAYTRDVEASTFGKERRMDWPHALRHFIIERHGPYFFEADEFNQLRRRARKEYYQRLARALIRGRLRGGYLAFHKGLFYAEGRRLEIDRLALAVVTSFLDLALNPKSTAEAVGRALARYVSSA